MENTECDTVDFSKVREDELKEIEERRGKAGFTKDKGSPSNTLIGLALSGGGIRSACFNMGLLQALHKTGIWRLIDYMATVSGGGYIAAFLTSAAQKSEKRFTENDFPLSERASPKQPAKVLDFIYGGRI